MPEVAAEQATEILPELGQEWLVQPERVADPIDILRRGPNARDHPGRIRREDEGHEEGNDSDREQHDDRPADAADDVRSHSRSRLVRG